MSSEFRPNEVEVESQFSGHRNCGLARLRKLRSNRLQHEGCEDVWGSRVACVIIIGLGKGRDAVQKSATNVKSERNDKRVKKTTSQKVETSCYVMEGPG